MSMRASPDSSIIGRGAPFPPQQIEALRELLRQSPPARARWSLRQVGACLWWLESYSPSGIWRVLQRCRLRYKRGRHHLHSPDPAYLQKRDYARGCLAQARQRPGRVVTLYLDEMSYYRQPTLSSAWSSQGARHQPRARLSHRRNSLRRVVGALDVVTGQVIAEQWPKVGVRRLAAFYQVLRRHYPEAEVIHLIQDNWPIHFYPQVERAAAAAQIEMVRLPTYAPWLNPIEKLWRKLRQEVLHMHRLSDDWQTLQQRVRDFLDTFAQGSRALLHYVGLLPN